jgi:hypothetical protein
MNLFLDKQIAHSLEAWGYTNKACQPQAQLSPRRRTWFV